MSQAGILLVGHGTRDAEGMAECAELAAKIAQAAAPRPVEVGYIEVAEPAIGKAFDRIVERGARRVRVVPLLLFSAGHAKLDLPAALGEASRRHRGIEVATAATLGLDEPILALSQRRYDEALADRPPIDGNDTFWLLVGRGSSDIDACQGLAEFARRQAEHSSLTRYGWCFVAAARPTLEEGLGQAAGSGAKRILVQPHLLFRGLVLQAIEAAVSRWQARQTGVEWVVTAHLGPEQEVVNAIMSTAGPLNPSVS